MTTIALELERTLERLAPEKARVLESRVREVISKVAEEKELPTLEERPFLSVQARNLSLWSATSHCPHFS